MIISEMIKSAIEELHFVIRRQEKSIVTVYKLIAKGTIEENIVKLQEKKMALADQIIGGEEMGSGSFSKEELLKEL